ncbi:MAG: acylphosphatase [Deltaproteobacteria bacterium]|nr:acylphosphatase [Deltaproteobacteria bacterium]
MTHRQIQTHVLVTGRVQGVSYRAATRKMALQLNLRGWVRNLPDGRVEAVFAGVEPSVHAMVAWCQRGPLHAAVSDVATARQPIEAFSGFDIRPTPPAPQDPPDAATE